jgi:5'-nucleotidase
LSAKESALARPRILVTNDDGVAATGLRALAAALRQIAQVDIVAPDHNWSASGHSKTMDRPLYVRATTLADGSPATMTSGSPSDCVAMALLGLLPSRPDLVVSGINQGANLSTDLVYSGTVAAAREAVFAGVPAIAVSLNSVSSDEYGPAAAFCVCLAQQLLAQRWEKPAFLNVNVPALPASAIRGVQVTRLGTRVYRDALVAREDPRGRPYYWIGGEPPTGIAEPGTDFGALNEGYISVTPVSTDLTDYQRVDVMAPWAEILGSTLAGAQGQA